MKAPVTLTIWPPVSSCCHWLALWAASTLCPALLQTCSPCWSNHLQPMPLWICYLNTQKQITLSRSQVKTSKMIGLISCAKKVCIIKYVSNITLQIKLCVLVREKSRKRQTIFILSLCFFWSINTIRVGWFLLFFFKFVFLFNQFFKKSCGHRDLLRKYIFLIISLDVKLIKIKILLVNFIRKILGDDEERNE